MSTREAQRHLSQLLDELETEESAVLIVRYGRPAALLVPFEETGQALKLPRLADLSLVYPEPEEEIDDVSLEPMQERVLLDITHCTDRFWRIDRILAQETDRSAIFVAITRLEMAGLIEREWHGGFLVTRKGKRVARGLDSMP